MSRTRISHEFWDAEKTTLVESFSLTKIHTPPPLLPVRLHVYARKLPLKLNSLEILMSSVNHVSVMQAKSNLLKSRNKSNSSILLLSDRALIRQPLKSLVL
jgi:hypothetical protein